MAKLVRLAVTPLLIAFLALPACGKKKPAEPPPEPTATAEAATTAAPEPSATETAEPAPPPAPALKEVLGTIAKIEVMKIVAPKMDKKKHLTFSKAPEVEKVLGAIGLDQSAKGDLRKCPDDFVLIMKDKDDAEKGTVGICNAETLGPEFTPAGGERKGITIPDEAAFRKLLKLPKAPAPKP
jgi:predicted small lipoprotein YifL